MRYTEKKIENMLRQSGFRITPQRRTILSTITRSHEHLTPAEIYKRMYDDHPDIGLVTIYRTLEILTEMELICELHAGGNCRSYTISAPQRHHHHLICSNCGKVVDFTGHNLDELERRLTKESGFRIDDHLLEFTGLCQACKEVP